MSSSRPRSAVPLPPRQARSRETLERILAAVDELLQEELFEALSMAEVARRAGVSVGTIYTRFRAKDDLLPALFARHQAAVGERVATFLEELGRLRSLRARIERVVGFAVDYHRDHRGLLRALTMYVRANPDGIPAQAFRERAAQYRAVAALVVGDARGVRRERPLEAAEFALGVVNSVCREQVLFDDVTPLRGRRRSLASLKRRLAALVHRDLTARQETDR